MRIAICDDKCESREMLSKMLLSINTSLSLESYGSSAALLEAVRQKPAFTAVFMEIALPGESGMDTARSLLQLCPETAVVFVTDSRQYAVEAFVLGAVHYLLRPISAEGVQAAMERVLRNLPKRNQPMFHAKVARRGTQGLLLHDIALITSLHHDCVLTLFDRRALRVSMSITEVRTQLDDSFLQLQRGVVVHMAFIERMERDRCLLHSGQMVLLSRSSRAEITRRYSEYVMSQTAVSGGVLTT